MFFVSRLTRYRLQKSFTLFLNLLKILVGVGFVIEVPVENFFNLRDRDGWKAVVNFFDRMSPVHAVHDRFQCDS